jgi:hypothetical protein
MYNSNYFSLTAILLLLLLSIYVYINLFKILLQLDGYETQDLMYDPSILSTSGQKHINWPAALQAAVTVKKGTVVTVSNKLSSYAIAPLPYLNFTSKSLGPDPDVVFVRGVNKVSSNTNNNI